MMMEVMEMMETSKLSARSRPAVKAGKEDVFMSIHPEHINNIAASAKNHEYRRYRLPSSVHRIWFYTTAPLSQIQYVARVSQAKIPGEVREDGGIGNADFNAGKKASKYAYEILDLWKLKQPISLKMAISEGFLNGPPQKYCWVSVAFLESYPLDGLEHLTSRTPTRRPLETRKDSDPENSAKCSPSLAVI